MWKGKASVCRVCSLLLILLTVLFCRPVYGAATDKPDPGRTGSISVTMRDEEHTAVGGGTLTLYTVAEFRQENGQYFWVYTEEFKNCGLKLEHLSDASSAKTLQGYAQAQHLQGVQTEISPEGELIFEDLGLSLYLIVQEDAADSYYPINPFVVSVPFQENGQWEYEVDASPKMELYTRKPPTPVEPPETVSSSRTGDLAGNTPELMVTVILTVSVVILLATRRIIRQSRV